MDMALSATILPSISTFSNQKEKCWEHVSCLLYVSTPALAADALVLPLRQTTDLYLHTSIFACLEFIDVACLHYVNGLHSETNCVVVRN